MRVRPYLILPLAALLALCIYRAQVQLSEASAQESPPPAAEPVPAPPALPAASPRPRPPRTLRVSGRGDVVLRKRPGGDAVGVVGPTTEFGSPRVLSVAARRGAWLGVVTEDQPNGKLAWVKARDRGVRAGRTRWSLHADLSDRRVELRRGDRVVRTVTVAIGTAGSPTPTGRFSVTDKIPGTRYGSYYGCCILALSGTQPNPPPGWTGGNRLAIHGTNAPSTIGTPASAGCLRAADDDLQVLMRLVPLGTPVLISA